MNFLFVAFCAAILLSGCSYTRTEVTNNYDTTDSYNSTNNINGVQPKQENPAPPLKMEKGTEDPI